jgi:predicted phosphoribosyltransferase
VSRQGRFADLSAAGLALAPLLTAALSKQAALSEQAALAEAEPILLGIEPDGLVVALAVADRLRCSVLTLPVLRSHDGVQVIAPVDLVGRPVVLIDAGVETGTTARAAGVALREAGVGRLILAVPVCPREVEATLVRTFDTVIAVVRPLVRRDLRWHYEVRPDRV